MVMLYLYAFLSTDGCGNKNVHERFVSPCTCMLENNERYLSNKETIFTEYGMHNRFHPTMNFYLPSVNKIEKTGTVFSNLRPPLDAVAHHTMGVHLPTVSATHPAVLHLRHDPGTTKAIDKYMNFLFGPKRNKWTDHNATVDMAIKCSVGHPHDFIKGDKTQCGQVKEISNILSIIRQKKLCLEAGYSDEHCGSDLACCITAK